MSASKPKPIVRSQLLRVNGGVHLEFGIKNAKTGQWEERHVADFPDPKPDLMVPTHIEFGIQDKNGLWITRETRDYLRPVKQDNFRKPARLYQRALGVLDMPE